MGRIGQHRLSYEQISEEVQRKQYVEKEQAVHLLEGRGSQLEAV